LVILRCGQTVSYSVERWDVLEKIWKKLFDLIEVVSVHLSGGTVGESEEQEGRLYTAASVPSFHKSDWIMWLLPDNKM
jgi:hypothetical protein